MPIGESFIDIDTFINHTLRCVGVHINGDWGAELADGELPTGRVATWGEVVPDCLFTMVLLASDG